MRARSFKALAPAALVAALAGGLAGGCGSAPPRPVYETAPTSLTPSAGHAPLSTATTLADVGLDASAMDRSVDPCTDFYSYACGGWMKATAIPGDEPMWMRSFDEIQRRNEEALRAILDEARKATKADAMTQRLGAYYGACMDEDAVESAGVKPVLDLIARARKVAGGKDTALLLADLHARRIWAFFDVAASQDFKDATRVIANLDQNGLGLPDRDQYLDKDEKAQENRAFYEGYVKRMMMLVGLPEKAASDAATDVMRVETELSRVSKTRVERRDPKGLYNKLDRAALAKAAPRFAWGDYLRAMGADVKDVNVTSVPFFEGMSALLGKLRPQELKNYLSFRIIDDTAMLLPKAFVDEKFKLQQRLTGQAEPRPRWKRCVEATDAAMGELLAQPYVARHFAGESKEAAERMVAEIGRAFAADVKGLAWMDDATKQRALAKLDAMAYLIGYPGKWKTYDFTIDPKSYGASALAARALHTRRDLAKIGQPLDRDEWQMSPQTVNAYYDPQRNHMVFPAGIMQPPFYSVKATLPVNLGGMGMVVGHELTHGFDDQGAQFDGQGNLADWWEKDVSARFAERTACVAEKYAAFEALPGLHLNGKLTLGENIADIGGLKLAFAAYREMRKGAAEVLVAEGHSEDQQFFLAHGQAWCGKGREAFERLMVQVNPHSPPRFRVNGPLRDLREFSDAYSCAAGTPMHPTRSCEVW